MGSSLSLCCKSTAEESVVDEDYAESGTFQDDSGSGHEDTNADNGTVADVEGQTAGQSGFAGIEQEVRVEVFCNELTGTLILPRQYSQGQERIQYKNERISGSDFERRAGRQASRKWKQSVRVRTDTSNMTVENWIAAHNYYYKGWTEQIDGQNRPRNRGASWTRDQEDILEGIMRTALEQGRTARAGYEAAVASNELPRVTECHQAEDRWSRFIKKRLEQDPTSWYSLLSRNRR
jgi:hypothetical protein|tara:strand:+ start:158 stop:862 length:705 start_codon:yes stop_codon:yes gene_type:complete